MQPRTKNLAMLASAIGSLAVGFVLDRSGIFLYFGYEPIAIAGSVAAAVLLVRGFALRSGNSRSPYLCVAASLTLILAAWSIRYVDSGPRKHFYLLSTRIKAGEPIESVSKVFVQYESWKAQEGFLSFRFVSGPGTADVIIVHYDPRTRTVLDSELSLD